MTSLGKYELHEQLGRGGFGTVYRAVDTTLNREVALKVLHPQLTTDPDFLERFQNEARLVASLDNPSIVPVYELSDVDGRVFIAMKYLQGGSLKQKLEKEGPIPFPETLKIMNDICNGLQEAHEKGLVHRDVKPANILFDKKGRAVIGDFGLARAVQLSSSSAASNAAGGAGTPAYRAPELWNGKPPASPATDVYSLACVLYEILTGRVLFDGGTPEEFLIQHVLKGPSLPESFPKGVPAGIRPVLEKALTKDPASRYQTVAVFAGALEGCAAKSDPSGEKEPGKGKEKEKSSKPPTPGAPAGAGRKKPAFKLSHKYLWILVVLATAVGLGIWLGGLPGNGPADPTPTEEPQARALTEIPTAIPEPTLTKTTKPTPEPTVEPELGIGSTQISEIDSMEMVYVPAGDFLMGSPEGIGEGSEHPQHTVDLDAFWIDKTEVTNTMYAKCVTAGDCSEPAQYSSYTRDSYYGNSAFADFPVIYVDWNQARNYCVWVGRSLPTEAQWEKAARGIDGLTYPWGNQAPDSNLANYYRNEGDTTKAGSYPAGASPYGALDVAGNVWEWVADWYDADYYGNSPSNNPAGPVSGEYLVLRGGSWGGITGSIRSAMRLRLDPSDASSSYGFRCALSRP